MKKLLFALLLVALSSQISYSQDTLWTRKYNIPGSIKNAVFSPDDSKILVTGTETFFEVNPENGEMIRELPEFTKYGIVGLNPETNIGLTYNCQLVNLLDYKKIRDVFSTKYFDTNVTLVYNITYTKDFNKFAMVYYNPDGVTPSSIIIKDIEKDIETLIYSEGSIEEEGFYTCALSPDGRYLATVSNYIGEIGTTSDNRELVKLFDLTTNEMIKKIEFPDSKVLWTMKFSPDGTMLAVNDGYIQNYTVPNFELKNTLQFTPEIGEIFDYQFSNNSQQLALGGSGILQNFEVQLNKLLYNTSFYRSVDLLEYSYNDKYLLSSNARKEIFLFNSKVTSIKKIDNSILIYPSPVTGQLILRLSTLQVDNCKILILDSSGKNLFEKEYQPTNEDISINVAHFPKGVYFINVENNNQILETLKFIKE